MSNINKAFENGKAFVAFITCGDPDLETTKKCVIEMAKNGADLIELGIPFSDPTAEGPVIMSANMRALAGGVTTDKIFEMVREIRCEVAVPMVFMTYANVVFSYGTEKFISICSEIGIDGLILPDVPYEEKEEFFPICERYGLDFVSLIAPTSEKRIEMIARDAKGFLYIVSSMGVTGERKEINRGIDEVISLAKRFSPVPCAVGFGISTPDQAYQMSRNADGVIVGSAIVRIIAEEKENSPKKVGEYVKSMKDALNCKPDVCRNSL